METIVSIIMPAYNVAAYIGESIKSVINQEYTAWELIVVNDGSSDSTAAVVKSFAEKDSRIKLYEQENWGVSAARNQGIRMAMGRYIAFLDGDDLWDKSFLRKVVAAKELHDVDMVFSGYQKMDKQGRLKKFRFQYADGDILLLYVKGIVGMCIGSVLIDKKLLVQNNILFTENCDMGEDTEFWIKVISIAKVQAVRENLMIYRTRADSIRHCAFRWEKSLQRIAVLKRSIEYVKKHRGNHVETANILSIMQENIRFLRYRLLWRMVKHGNHREALAMMAEPECIAELTQINKKKLSMNQQLQYNIVLSRNRLLWNLCALLR